MPTRARATMNIKRRTLLVFFSIVRLPPISTLFPYTTLFDLNWYFEVFRCLVCGEQCSRRRLLRQGNGHARSEEHTSELQSHSDIVCRLLLEKKISGAHARCELLDQWGRIHSP